MKKKYSTLLNFALAGCLATTLAACGSDGDSSGGKIKSDSNPTVNIGGTVLDTNGNPLAGVKVSCEAEETTTNSSGQYNIKKLRVHNVIGGRTQSTNSYDEQEMAVTCVVNAPDGYLGARVYVWPEAQVINTLYDNTSEELTNTNQPLIWFEGMYAEAATAWLPKLDSEVCGVLRMCGSGQPVTDAQLRLDMWAVDNNDPVEQADATETDVVTYSTAMYSTTTDAADGTFCIDGVPDDSILRIFAPEYQELSVDGNGYADVSSSCSGTKPCQNEGAYITTTNEGLLTLGNVCVNTIPSGDSAQPCVVGVTEFVHSNAGAQLINNSEGMNNFVRWAVLPDDVDGTGDGFAIVFNETMNPAEVDENSVVIWNEGPDPSDLSDDDYLTAFTAAIEGNSLHIVTAEPLGDDDHLKIYLLSDDFQDWAGNYLTGAGLVDNDVCTTKPWVEDFWSLNDTKYTVVAVKIFSPDDTNVGPASNLAQNCLDYSEVVSNQTDLQDQYPTTFRSERTSSDTFFNLNADSDYEHRLEALADVIQCPSDANTYNANIVDNYASITFMAPDAGGWQISSPQATCDDNCYGTGDSATEISVISDVAVGDTVCVDSYDDFANLSDQICITVGDCVAPTTVLNFAYNTCGHIGYDGGDYTDNSFRPAMSPNHTGGGNGDVGYDTDYAAHLCVDFEVASLQDYGDGGENTGEGVPGVCGIPTLNITCRLLKDPADAALGGVMTPITFYGLYDGADTPAPVSSGYGPYSWFSLYDATEFAAWSPVDTIGIAFSEDIMMSGGDPDFSTADSLITSWNILNNVGTTDDGDNPDGMVGSTADLAHITVSDIVALANDEHQTILDFTDAIDDTAGNPADNARVVINDLMPPFVEYAYWDGGMTIKFNETVAPDITDVDGTADSIVLWDRFGNADHISLDGATLTDIDGGTDNLLIIPSDNLADAFIDGSENFPQTTDTTHALVYDEQTYDDLGFTGPYQHGAMNWNNIPDAQGNTWGDYDSSAGHNNVIYREVTGGELCNMPSFAVADVLGPFEVTSINVSGGFADNEPVDCQSGGSGPVTHIMTYTMTQPVKMTKDKWTDQSASLTTCPSIDTWCAGGSTTMCTLDQVNSFLNADWVDSCVTLNDSLVGNISWLTGIGATLDNDRMGISIEVENDCSTFESGDDLDPDWKFWSSFGIGTGKNLGAQSAP